MSALFVSDVHLSTRRPTEARAFLALLAALDARTESLYLLGDIFDAWIGDDHEHPLHAEVADALHALRDGGTAVYLIHGNHDFLLAEGYAARCGARLLPDPVDAEFEPTAAPRERERAATTMRAQSLGLP